jgi:hypothetical protein
MTPTLLILLLSLAPQQAHYRHHGSVLLPDPIVTPGKTNPAVTKKISCSTKWGKDERAVTEKMKAQVYAAYGTGPKTGTCAPVSHKGAKGKKITKNCEIDHLISRELGGADDPTNLWAQPYLTPDQPGAYQKDKLENWLHKQVCSGNMELQEAQQKISVDWYSAYLEMEKQK